MSEGRHEFSGSAISKSFIELWNTSQGQESFAGQPAGTKRIMFIESVSFLYFKATEKLKRRKTLEIGHVSSFFHNILSLLVFVELHIDTAGVFRIFVNLFVIYIGKKTHQGGVVLKAKAVIN